jgi:hypothetical protein
MLQSESKKKPKTNVTAPTRNTEQKRLKSNKTKYVYRTLISSCHYMNM